MNLMAVRVPQAGCHRLVVSSIPMTYGPSPSWSRRRPMRLAASFCLLAAALGCGGGAELESARSEAPAVEAVPARAGTLPLVERVSGTVRAIDQVEIRPEIEARVVEVLVRSGEAVERGQPLVRLDDAVVRERLTQAGAALRLAGAAADEAEAQAAEQRAQVTRTRALAERSLVSELELETREAQLVALEANAAAARARVEQARATVEERRTELDRTVVRSPVTGRVGQRRVEVGTQVDRSTALFVVGNLDRLLVEVPLTDDMLGRIRDGMPVRIAARALGDDDIPATLDRISPFLESGSFSTVGEIDLEDHDGRLRPGMFVEVDILYGESERATLVPAAAVWEDPQTGIDGVFVVAVEGAPPAAPPGTDPPEEAVAAEFRQVEVLGQGRGTVGVAGVAPGEWVVTVGQQLLPTAGDAEARVRPASWERVLSLQRLQDEDVLLGYLEEQQRMAATHGVEPPSNEEFFSSAAPAAGS